MTFLSPLSAVLAGVVAVPLLTLLYLLKLRRRPVRVSSTLLWEQTVKDLQANEPFRWLRPGVLFVLQLLALLALLLALARPVIPGSGPLGQRVVILVDVSASMNATDVPQRPNVTDAAPRTRLDLARERARAIVDELARSGGGGGGVGTGSGGSSGERPQAMIAIAASSTRAVTPFTADLRELRDAIDAIAPTDEPLSIEGLATFVRAIAPAGSATPANAGDAAAGARPARVPVSISLLSDGGFEPGPLRDLPAGAARWVFQPLGPGLGSERASDPQSPATEGSPSADRPSDRAVSNAGIVAISASRQADDPATIRVFVRVISTDPTARKLSVVARVLDVRRLEPGVDAEDGSALAPDASLASSPAKSITLALPGASRGPSGLVQPAEATGAFEINNAASCLVTLELPRADILQADNIVGIFVPALRRPKVLVVVPDGGTPRAGATEPEPAPADTAAERADVFIMSALDAAQVAGVRVVTRSQFDRGLTGGTSPRPGEWAGYDLLMFDRVSPPRLPPLPSISFGAGLPGVASMGPDPRVIAPSAPNVPVSRFLTWERTHPVMRDVKLEPILTRPALGVVDLAPSVTPSPAGAPSPPPVAERCRLVPLALGSGSVGPTPTDAGTANANGNFTSAAAATESQVLVASLECRVPSGPDTPESGSVALRRLLVGFELDRSNWGPSESFPIFIANAIDWLTVDAFSGSGRASRTSDTVRLDVPVGASTVQVRSPLDQRPFRTLRIAPGVEQVPVGPFPRTGVYAVVAAGADGRPLRSAEPAIAVNLLDVTESICARRDQLALGDSEPAGPDRVESGAPAASPDSGREIWIWFVALAAALLAVEWFVYAWQSRV